MALSQLDIEHLAEFTRKLTKAPGVEKIISATFDTLNQVGRIDRMRVVYPDSSARWSEWTATNKALEVREPAGRPTPERSAVTVLFDPENPRSGYISAETRNRKIRVALEIIAPQLWSGLLLQMVLQRVQKTSGSEAELVRATLRVRDEERRRIARDLHDDLGQSLASLKLTLKWTENLVRQHAEIPKALSALSSARDLVGVMMDKTRDLSHILYPRILDIRGLIPAIKELAHEISQHSAMTIECKARGTPRALDKNAQVALYRCCQEVISNAIRHSHASRLAITVRFAQEDVRITVEDNGKGFDPRSLYNSKSQGLASGFWTIRQRLADLNATFRVSTSEGKGTAVEMVVPYSLRKVHGRTKSKTAAGR
jgi:signal transduction histidine kinase